MKTCILQSKKIEQLDVFNCLPLLSTEFRCAGLTSWTEKRKKKENRGGNSSVEKKSRRFFVGRASAEKQASGAGVERSRGKG